MWPKNPKNWHLGAKLTSAFGKFLSKREYLGWNSLKSCKYGLMIRKFSLGKGMFPTKMSIAKGIRPKTRAAHPSQKFLGAALVIARCGETTHSGVDVNNTHLSMINPLNIPLRFVTMVPITLLATKARLISGFYGASYQCWSKMLLPH